jgi:hypothetical protein
MPAELQNSPTADGRELLFFLDFDGVLHPLFGFLEDGKTETAYGGPYFEFASQLASILSPYLHAIEIVISSSWGRSRSIDELRALLPSELAARVTDAIWMDDFDSYYGSALCTRYGCIAMWLERKRSSFHGAWLALDDDADGWPAEMQHHLVHAWGTLSSSTVQQELAKRLRDHFGY